jgi:hypothetical protein
MAGVLYCHLKMRSSGRSLYTVIALLKCNPAYGNAVTAMLPPQLMLLEEKIKCLARKPDK